MALCSRPHLDQASIDRFNALILDATVNLNCIEDGQTPLLMICKNNQSENLYEHVQSLLKTERIDINAQGRDQSNTLATVCKYYGGKKLLEIVQLLLRQGIDASHTNSYGLNALFALTSNRSDALDPRLYEIVKALVDGGLDALAKCKDGFKVFDNLQRRHSQHHDFAKIIDFITKKEIAASQMEGANFSQDL